MRRTFRDELVDVTAAAERGDPPAPAVTIDRWEEVLGALWVNVGEQVYPAHVQHLTEAKQTRQLIALVQQIVRRGAPATQVARFVEEQAQGIITYSRRRIHTVLRELDQPAQVRTVTRALARLYRTDFVRDRAARIALDQTLRASTTFEYHAAQQVTASTGRQYEQVWVTQGDSRVRPAHAAADGQQVPLEKEFDVGGELLRYPRDPAGSAGNTINCRCWVEHVRL